jgi:hypothetical protein
MKNTKDYLKEHTTQIAIIGIVVGLLFIYKFK